jgi:hypothetical protein
VPGAVVCRYHGGAARQVREKGAQRQAEQRADEQLRRALAELDVEPVEDPFTELGRLAGQVLSWKDRLAGQVNALTGDPCDACGGGGRLRYEAVGAGTEQLRAEVAVFERAMDRCIAVLGLIAKLDIDSRLARISDKQADAVIRAVDAALVAAGASGPAAVDGRKAAARELRASA